MDRRISFDAAVDEYDRVRHTYPPEAFADLFAWLREGPAAVVPDVLEIGPGTGKATQSLLESGARVTGVELGPQMAAHLRKKYAEESRFSVVESSFETVELPGDSFDIVLAATAFHWIDPDVRIRKAVELLRPAGVLATLSTVQVESEVSGGYFERSRSIYEKYEGDGEPGYVAPSPDEAIAPEFEEMRASELLVDAQFRRYRWDQTYTSTDYADLCRSYSNMQMMDAYARESLIGELCGLIDDEFCGRIVRPLVIVLSMARRA